jgi:hypothetical protein
MEPVEKGDHEPPLEPLEQDVIPFHGEQIVAARLADGRIAVVLRWICESLRVDPQAQVRRIQRTSITASELIRIRVQTPGGRQAMPAITLRGFSPWILGINPNEVKHEDAGEAERIRALIIAYQEEAKDVLYEHFVNKRRMAGPSSAAIIVPASPLARPEEPGPGADDQAFMTYYEDLAVWALWKAHQHAQRWRGQVQGQLDSLQTQLESEKAVTDLIPDIITRLGPETITPEHQRRVQALVAQLSQVSGKHRMTIYDDLKTAFNKPRYQDLREDEWGQVERWFVIQIERARKKPGR